jgi:hypothetical protein
MISVAPSAIENVTIARLAVEEQPPIKLKPVVICGSCGAQELSLENGRTECPHCDDYIY